MGYFSHERWVSSKGEYCHEIAINPTYVARSSLIELLQTLVHEMVHCWQQDFGNLGRRGYHNKEWATKMESIGLMPSSTSQPGGAKTGDTMGDYPVPDSLFVQECSNLISAGFDLPWVDRFTLQKKVISDAIPVRELVALGFEEKQAEVLSSGLQEFMNEDSMPVVEDAPKGRIKSRYSCSGCKINVWGKPELKLYCL